MQTLNPYEPPAKDEPTVTDCNAQVVFHWSLLGALLAASLPVVVGATDLYREWVLATNGLPIRRGCCESHPAELIVLGGSFFGLIGGVAGDIAARLLISVNHLLKKPSNDQDLRRPG